MPNNLSKQEEQIEEHIQKGDTAAAVEGLYELIVIYAKDKDFKKAEALRDRLYDTDSMALTQIINANEIIEKEKAGAISVDHRRTWSKLYDQKYRVFYYGCQIGKGLANEACRGKTSTFRLLKVSLDVNGISRIGYEFGI